MSDPTLDPVERYLTLWAGYMQAWQARDDVGYPTHSAGFGSISGAVCDDTFDHLCEQADATAARAMDAIIDGLQPDQRAAVYHKHLLAVFRMRDLEGSYERARIAIRAKLGVRGLV